MWDEQNRCRFQELRQGQEGNTLTETEKVELGKLFQELEAAEAAYLTPATERTRQEHLELEAQNRTLENLVKRKEALVQRLGDFLAKAKAERGAIESELAEVLAGSQSSVSKD
jgi:hypothetical protein